MIRMRRALLGVWTAIFAASFSCAPARAQSGVQNDFLPEIDLTYGINPDSALYFQAKEDREGGAPQQATIGPSLLLYRKPLMQIKRLVVFDIDQTKSRRFVLETGYRVITAPDTPVKNRLIESLTLHYPLLNEVLITDRVRFDLDWQNGTFPWRFRNKLTVEKTLLIHGYHFAPYVAAEPFYEAQYSKWASTDLYAGSLLPLGKRAQFNIYYQHENDTGTNPNTQKNYIGVVLQIYLGKRE